MKKKTLLITLLALAIVTSITAGTLAVYTRTVTFAEQVDIKKFAFSAAGSKEASVSSIKLAPTEKGQYIISVSNTDTTGQSEVPLDYTVTVNYGAAATTMDGLVVSLAKGGNGTVVSNNDNQLVFSGSLSGSDAETHEHKVIVDWKGGSDANHTPIGEGAQTIANALSVTVVATQKTN